MDEEQNYSRLDLAFSRFLAQRCKLDSQKKKDFAGLVAELSYQQSQGHSCIHVDLTEQKLIQSSGLAWVIETGHATVLPLVLEENRLYLHRYWFYEQRLAKQINQIIVTPCIKQVFEALLNRYFIELIDETDWQREAAKKALEQAFTIITGGPGTGKTTTVVKVLALLQELSLKQGQSLHIALAAPTGKAAIRLQESIANSKNNLPCSEAIKALIPETVTTLHRMLGAQPPSPYFKHDATNPLLYDLVVVDEASMVDLALMSKLVDALKPASRLILLGDKDQLASVESGAVLADLTTALTEQTVELIKSHRFNGEIKALADAVNKQDAKQAWQILEKKNPQVSLLEENLIEYIVKQYANYLLEINNYADFIDILNAFNQFQVLCSNRQGEKGVYDINEKVEQELHRQKKLQLSGAWYVGRPVMVTQNNANLQLFNGDIGICLYDREAKKVFVYFLRSDGSVKKVVPSRMPVHETVFAMTIHKSQGSEFEQCLCVLPDFYNPVLSKELIYTAITRAKTTLKLVASESIFTQTVKQKVARSSGLFEKLIN